MKRKMLLLLATLAVMTTVAALAVQKKPSLLVLDWASKAAPETPPTAILIELGLKDAKSNSWSGQAMVTGAKVVHREGYRFRDKDKLTDPDGWDASSHRPLRGIALMPKGIPIIQDPIASVGVVLHLADVKPDATLSLSVKDQEVPKAAVPLKDVLAGKTHSLWEGKAAVRLVTTATPVVTAKTEDDFPAACYGPDGTLWVAYISYTVRHEDCRIESPQFKEQPKDFKAYNMAEFGDQLFVKYYKDGKWSEPIAVTEPKQDLVRCAIAVDNKGVAWVAYSAQRNGAYDVYIRSLNPNASPKTGSEVRLPTPAKGVAPASRLTPVLATRADGSIWLACQSWSAEAPQRASVLLYALAYKQTQWVNYGYLGRRAPEDDSGPVWHPAISVGTGHGVTIAGDATKQGDYDVEVMTNYHGDIRRHVIAGTPHFEARPSICWDPQGRLWIAYEEGPEKWGKDYGALDDQDGHPLYFARTVKVVCLVDGKLMKPLAELPPLAARTGSPDTGQKVEALPRYAYPQIGIDGKGRVWVTYRQKFGTRYTTHPGSYWLTFARRLDGDKWTEPIEVHHSDGLLDDRPVLLPHPSGGLRIVHNTDGRYSTPDIVDNQIYMSYLDLPGDPVEPKLVAHDPGKKDPKLVKEAQAEQAAVKRIRAYRIESGGKKYQMLRGEFHRHTEMSWDGGPDGSLEDMFRYGIDAADMDWIGNGDHDSGAGREYFWWLIQKFTDAYHVKERFTPMHTYERSVSYPHGHRNCMFAQRGIRTLPRLAEEDPKKRVASVHADDAKMLYRYLREHNGICAMHTSATGMGTDWRDNDPVVEPIVEIYQGDRMSYEKEGAPRAGYDPEAKQKPVNIGGWRPLGFVNLALQKGYKLGFQASSDHFSTHISYCIVLAEKHDRQGILDAVKKRHVYGATDNMIVDLRSGAYIQGDEFKTSNAPTLQMTVVGTGPLARIDILKDSEVVDTIKPGKQEYQGTWTDPKPTPGVHYYYIRVLQTDDELAWASPMWIDYGK